MKKQWLRSVLLGIVTVSCGCMTILSAETAAAPHVLNVGAITEVFGDGQKVSAVTLEYDCAITTALLGPDSFSVAGKKVTKVYATTEAAKAAIGTDGKFVIVELDTAIQPETDGGPQGSPAGTAGAGNATRPAGFMQLTLGQKTTDSADEPPLSVSVIQTGSITTTAGKVYGPSSVAMTNGSVVNLITQDFQKLVFTDANQGGATLMYNLYVPKNYDPAKKYPLVLFMPDASVTSNKPTATLRQGLGAIAWATPEFQAKHPCFVLAPQYNAMIANDDSKSSVDMDVTVDLVGDLVSRYSIDSARLYSTGQSGGGMTAIAMNIKYPRLFAASFLVACQWNPALVAPMAGKPLWIIVSEGDAKAKPGMDAITAALSNLGSSVTQAVWNAEASQDILARSVADMLAANATINYAVFKGGNHMYTWKYAYSIPGVQEWLFSQINADGLSSAALYSKGIAAGRSGDNATSFAYIAKAVQMGYAEGYAGLAECYQTGRGTAADFSKAVSYGEKAVLEGSNARAFTNLGILYLNGQGVNRDYRRALDLFVSATAKGDFKGPRYAGIMYYTGLVEGMTDYAKAAEYFTTASQGGDITANYYLALMYERGQVFKQDYAKAAEYYAKAAPSVGHAETIAMVVLGQLYEKGLGVTKSQAKAIELYSRAADLGDNDAKAALKRLTGN